MELSQTADHPKIPLSRSYAKPLSHISVPKITTSNAQPLPNPHSVGLNFSDAIAGSHKGFPSMTFEDGHISDLAKSFSWTLVGKFSRGYDKSEPQNGRPSVADLEKYFSSLDLQSTFSIGLLDNRHLLIRLSSEVDFLRLYSRTVWYVAKVTMRIFKWSPFFTVDRETSLVPVWITLPRLPIIFFAKPALFCIASLLGTPLRLDAATTSLKRPGVARLQVEIDLLKPRPNQIWIGMGSVTGFWQRIEYEHVPEYCTHCWHAGHAESDCTVHNPGLKSIDCQPVLKPPALKPSAPKPPGQEYRPVSVIKAPKDKPPEYTTSLETLKENPMQESQEGNQDHKQALDEPAPRLPVIFCGDNSDSDEVEVAVVDYVHSALLAPAQDLATSTTEAPVEQLNVSSPAVTQRAFTVPTGPQTTGDLFEMPTGIYFRQQIPLLRRSASSIGLTQSNKEDTPRHESGLNLDNDSESEEDNDTEAKNVVSPVPSAPSPTASPGEDEVLPLKFLSAPEIVDSMTDSPSTAMLQDEPPFQQPKNRRRKKKTQENSSQSRFTTASAFAILPDE